MTDNRLGGSAMVAGAVATLVTMSIHPSGGDFLTPGQFSSVAVLAVVAHTLAIVSMPVSFLGALALSRRVDSAARVASTALAAYGFALTAEMAAATLSGFVAPNLLHEVINDGPAMRDGWQMLATYTGLLNYAFAGIFVIMSSIAIGLWSVAIVRSRILARGVGIYGLLMAPVIIIAVASGHVSLDVHGFGLVVLLQAIWFISVGILLWRVKTE